jgi:hypothetical protein
MVEAEIKANATSYDAAGAARHYGEELQRLAHTARGAMSEAGQTGSGLASLYEKTVSVLSPVLPGSQSEAKRQAAADALLDSIKPDILKLSRPKGSGATSDFEAKSYLGAGPHSGQTPEANALLAQKLEDLGRINVDYADYLEAYREANAGSTVGADRLWSEYKQDFPFFVGRGEKMQLNTDRPSWQEYFAARGEGMDPSSLASQGPTVESTIKVRSPNGEILEVSRDRYEQLQEGAPRG